MTVWVVRAGRRGEYEETFLSQSLAGILFDLGQSGAGFKDRESLREHMRARSSADERRTRNWANQVWSFINEIRSGDMIVLPRKSPRNVNVGRVSGDYEYREESEVPHVGPVEWERQEIPRSDVDQDLLNSLGGLATVFRVRARNAESRIAGMLDKNFSGDAPADLEPGSTASGDDELKVDLEEQINDRIIDRIRQRFSGARLEYLVAEILRASGYHALETRRGPDGGIDVVAGQGDMGFGQPRLCVQVKSGRSPVDLPDYNRLQGSIGSFGAEHGLLVSLGDFTRPVRNENERSFFQIRLWGPNDLVDKLLETYDELPADIRSEIPLRNRRILVETEQ